MLWQLMPSGQRLGSAECSSSARLQLARTGVAVWQLADSAALEMSESAPAATGDGEVDAGVVQIKARPARESAFHPYLRGENRVAEVASIK